MADCKCTLAAAKKDLHYDLVKENVLKIVSSVNEDYEEKTVLKCLLCNKSWQFTRNDSYHEPIINWRKI